MWGGIAAIVGLLLLVGESVIGLHSNGVSHANILMWLIVSPIVAVGSMVHKRIRENGPFGYGMALTTGLVTSFTATMGLLIVWLLFINVLFPAYFDLMHVYAESQARAQGHTGMLLAQEIHVAQLIFVSPTFYIISVFVPLLAGAIASVIGAIGIRKHH